MIHVEPGHCDVTAYPFFATYAATHLSGEAANILQLALNSLSWVRAYPILNILSIPGEPSSFGFDGVAALRKCLVEAFRASLSEKFLNTLKIFLAAEGRRAN